MKQLSFLVLERHILLQLCLSQLDNAHSEGGAALLLLPSRPPARAGATAPAAAPPLACAQGVGALKRQAVQQNVADEVRTGAHNIINALFVKAALKLIICNQPAAGSHDIHKQAVITHTQQCLAKASKEETWHRISSP